MELLVQQATAVKDRHIQFLMSLPAVVGAGIGLSKEHAGKAAIQVYVSRALSDKQRQVFPKVLEGVPVEVVETGAFRALKASSKKKSGRADSGPPQRSSAAERVAKAKTPPGKIPK